MTPDELDALIDTHLPHATRTPNTTNRIIAWEDRHHATQLVDAVRDNVIHSRMNTAIIAAGTTRTHLHLDVPADYAYTITAWACLWYHDKDPSFLPDTDRDYLTRLLADQFTAIVWELDFGQTLNTDERVDTLARLLTDLGYGTGTHLEKAGSLAASVTAANIDLVQTAVSLSDRTVRLPGARTSACLPSSRTVS